MNVGAPLIFMKDRKVKRKSRDDKGREVLPIKKVNAGILSVRPLTLSHITPGVKNNPRVTRVLGCMTEITIQ
jgi:hypothetical protein